MSLRTPVTHFNPNYGLNAILFDIGGVLTSDPWESILLTPKVGVVDQLGLPRDLVMEAVPRMWSRIAVCESAEADFWAALESDIGMKIPQAAVREAERLLLVPNRYARVILTAARDTGARVGVISDNTSFWYPKQAAMLGLAEFVEESMEFLSFREGISKSDPAYSLFDRAHESVDFPSVVIDDREHNLAAAEKVGFVSMKYQLGEPGEGPIFKRPLPTGRGFPTA